MKTRSLVLLILGACVAALAIAGVGGFFLFTKITSMVTGCEPVALAIQTVSRDPAVIERVGQPIEARLLGGTISIRTSGASGHAEMDSDCTGPKSHVRIIMSADKIDGAWKLRYLAYVLDGERHEVVPGAPDTLRTF